MKIAILSVSKTGFLLAKKIENKIHDGIFLTEKGILKEGEHLQILLGVKSQYEMENDAYIEESLKDYVARIFPEVEALIFISATGIALRMIAPLIDGKQTDPAVIVVDETGKFCISLLAGHLGGANELTDFIAKIIGAIPVITTATDRQNKFAVDNFAKENGLEISDFTLAKKISAAILHGEQVDLLWENGQKEKLIYLPEEVNVLSSIEERKNTYGIVVGKEKNNLQEEMKNVLFLKPMELALGIGCRKNTEKEKIEAAIYACLKTHGYHLAQVKTIASVDLKKDEKGILDFCKEQKIPFETYSSDELENVVGSLSSSDFVKKITGVDNVCERAALCYGGELVVKKEIYDSVTIAITKL